MTLDESEFKEVMEGFGLDPEAQQEAWDLCSQPPFKDWKLVQCLPYISTWYGLGLYDFLFD